MRKKGKGAKVRNVLKLDLLMTLALLNHISIRYPGEAMSLCPNCKQDVRGDNVIMEQLGQMTKVPIDNLIPMKLHTTAFVCPNCHVIIGVAQYVSY